MIEVRLLAVMMMGFTKLRVGVLAALTGVITVGGIGLWSLESRLAVGHPDCPGLGSPRVAVGTGSHANATWAHRTLDELMDQMGCKPDARLTLRDR